MSVLSFNLYTLFSISTQQFIASHRIFLGKAKKDSH